MNPPYERNLHLKIFDEAIGHITKDGTVVNLGPSTWLEKYNINRPMAIWRDKFNKKICEVDIIAHDEANSHFGTGNSIENLGIYTAKNTSELDLLKYGFDSDIEYSLYKKINIAFTDTTTIGAAILSKRGWRVRNSNRTPIRKPHDVIVYVWHTGKNCRDAVVRTNDKKISALLYFNSEVEKQNFLNSLDTTFMNWYWRKFIVTGDNKVGNYMFLMNDYTKPWTDEDFYKFFNITHEEQIAIERCMMKK